VGTAAKAIDPGDSHAHTDPATPSARVTVRERSLSHDVFGTYGTRALTIGLGMIMGIITARTLGPHNRGVFSLVYLLPSTVVTFAKMGLAQASVYSIRREHVAPHRVVANAFIVSIVLGGLFVTLAIVFRAQLLATFLRGVPAWALLVALPLIPLLLFESYFYAILQAMGKFGLYNSRLLIGTILLVLGMLIFLVILGGGLREAILVVVCVPILMDSWLLVTVRRWFPFSFRLDLPLLNKEVRFGLKSHIQVLAQHLHLRADAYLVAYFLDPAQVAFYVLAVRLAEFMLDIPESVGMVLYPRLASLDEHAMHELTAQACRRTLLITTTGAVLLSLFGPSVIVLWYGRDYAPAGQPLMLVSVGIVMMSIFVLLTRDFTSRNKQQVNIAAGSIALVGNITLNLFTIPRMGIVGAALASAISYSAAAVLLMVFFVRESRLSPFDVLIAKPDDFRFFWNFGVKLLGRGKAFALRHAT
jgi:O-antigen/teichoic acid export membrane protein